MDDRHHIEFLRFQAHECRIRALMREHPEAGRWLDLAREYDRQTEMLARLMRPRPEPPSVGGHKAKFEAKSDCRSGRVGPQV